MRRLAIAWLAALIFLCAADFAWIATMNGVLYKPTLGPLLLAQPVLWAVAAFYLLYSVGVAILALRPSLAAGSIAAALGRGAILGAVAYGTYDLSNMATLRGWSITVTIVDMLWGTILTAAASAAGVWSAQKLS